MKRPQRHTHPRSQKRNLGYPARINRVASQVSSAEVERPWAPGSLLVQIEKPIYGGNFLARRDGKAVFVPLALPGEQVRVRIVEEKRGYATAEIEDLVSASPQRVAAACPHFGPCGGCQYQHTDYETQLRIKQDVLRETLERGGVEAPQTIDVLSAEPWDYRNRIRVALDAHGYPGYRGRRSHAVVAIRECPIAAPVLVRGALAAAGVLRDFAPAVRPREMALFCNPYESALLVTIFMTSPTKVQFEEVAIELRKRIPELKGAELVIEGGANQLPRTLAQWGENSLVYGAASVEYRVDHGAFFQVNRRLVDGLVNRVTTGYRGTLAWDLFAGVGLFARKLADSFKRVVAVESAPAATGALVANLMGTSGSAMCASTLDFLRRNRSGPRPDLIVVDPPRTGLGADLTSLLVEVAAPALVYVSCDPATLARDLRVLIEAGYRIESMALADLFPQTFHLETVVRMRHP